MAVTTKMSVDVSGFKAGIQQAQNSVRTLDAELKRNEAQFKATGDKEKYMESQTKALNSRIAEQQKVVKNAENALKAMEQSGVKPTDAAYQQMQRTLLNAQTAIAQTTVQMNALDASEQKAAGNAEKMADSLASIGKKVSLDAVISGVNSITQGLEDAAKAAISFARDAWGEIMEVAGYADDIATKATMYGMTPTEYQAMANLAATWGETSVEDIMTARRRIWKNGRALAEEGVFGDLGINPYASTGGKYGTGMMKDWEDLFWESGAKLMGMEPFVRAEYGEKLFGRSWERLIPMFTMGREEYERQLGIASESVISDEDVQTMAKLNDTVGQLEQKLTALEGTIVSALAPGLTAAAEALGVFLDEMMKFLQSEKGQDLLDRMAEAVTGLFEDLAKVDPEELVTNLTTVFTKLIEGLKWLWEHKDDIVEAMKWIVAGWAGLKLTGGALDILKIVTGMQFLKNGGFNAAGNGAGGDTTVVTDSAPKESKMPGILDKAVAGMATKAVLDTSFALIENSRILADKTLSREEQLTQWADAQVAAGFIRPEDRDRVIANNSVLFLAVPEVPEDAAEDVSSQIGEVPVAVRPYVPGAYSAPPGDTHGGIGGGGPGSSTYYSMHSNGLPWVPRDGYLAMLHRGERVMTATENRNYTYNSNNYFGNVNLNNGMEIDALCDSIDRHNRRQHAGFGA